MSQPKIQEVMNRLYREARTEAIKKFREETGAPLLHGQGFWDAVKDDQHRYLRELEDRYAGQAMAALIPKTGTLHYTVEDMAAFVATAANQYAKDLMASRYPGWNADE